MTPRSPQWTAAPEIVLVAHGTRRPEGSVTTQAVADAVSDALPQVNVHIAYADVRAPSVTDVLRELHGRPVVVVPAFLAGGYHVRADIPEQIVESGHSDVAMSDHFGPSPEIVAASIERLWEAGYRPGDRVVLAAAGSSDPRALVDVADAAYAMGVRLGAPVRIGYAASDTPDSVGQVVDELRAADGSTRVAVASWLLAPGLFQQRLADAGADVIAEPLGAHDRVVDLVVQRYCDAVAARRAA